MPAYGSVPGRGPVIAIIGGGASGTLTAIHLLRAVAARQYPLRIALIDRLGRHWLGEAYSTTNPAHFLNALTARMSGVAGNPGHLLRWAGAAGLGTLEFLPRQAFGRYLQDTLADAERRATLQGAALRAARPGHRGFSDPGAGAAAHPGEPGRIHHRPDRRLADQRDRAGRRPHPDGRPAAPGPA
ncbi:MAG: FAD/NAD(P)-binding protein, partial [Streptosporangiaceae bacterium]